MISAEASQYRTMVREILDHTQRSLEEIVPGQRGDLAHLLVASARHVSQTELPLEQPISESVLARLAAEAAWYIILAATGHPPIGLTAAALPQHLTALDTRLLADRIRLVRTAALLTEGHRVPLDRGIPIAPQRRRAAGPCPCTCSSGGFCGGCGHAGCGGRR